MSLVRLLPLRTIHRFLVDGEWRELREPDGLATYRQLHRLNALGMLAVVEPGQVRPLTKGEAA